METRLGNLDMKLDNYILSISSERYDKSNFLESSSELGMKDLFT